MRNVKFAIGEYYHIYNRGTDKRPIFMDENDLDRYYLSMRLFNTINPIGSIFELGKRSLDVNLSQPLVSFVTYNLNFNHVHNMMTPLIDFGIEKFMHRLGTGYTNYFNHKYDRTGALFQGRFKAKHITSNEYLLHLSAYINLNDRLHDFGSLTSKSSWNEYIGIENSNFCNKNIILKQFKSIDEYIKFTESSLQDTRIRRNLDKSMDDTFID